MQFLATVGNAFLHLIRCYPFVKMHHSTIPFPYILPNRLRYYFVGYSLSHFTFGELLFFSHLRPKKRSKRTSLLLEFVLLNLLNL